MPCRGLLGRHKYTHAHCISDEFDEGGGVTRFCLTECSRCGFRKFDYDYPKHDWVDNPENPGMRFR